jgi:hypothetical protein
MQSPAISIICGIDRVILAEVQATGGGPSYRSDQRGKSGLNVNTAKLLNKSVAIERRQE